MIGFRRQIADPRQLTLFAEPAAPAGVASGPRRKAGHAATLATLRLTDLPESLREIAQLIGLDGVRLLVRHYGGRRLFVPEGKRRSGLAALLGDTRTRLLMGAYAGEPLYIPNLKHVLSRARDRELCRRWDAGEGVRTLAAAYGLSTTQVRTILHRAVPDSRPGSRPTRPR